MEELGTGLLQLDIMCRGRVGVRTALREAGEPHDDIAVDEMWIDLFKDPPEVSVGANHHVEHLSQLLPRLSTSLLDRWWLLTNYSRKALATSDHPVFVVPNAEDAALGLGTGFENAAEIHLPLTRRRSLTMVRRETLPPDIASLGRDLCIQGVSQTALRSNHYTVQGARRMIFHHPEDSPTDGFELPQPRLNELSGSGDPWRFMSEGELNVLIEAGAKPPRSDT